MTTLVTGGAGYIGSHAVAKLIAHGKQVVVIDNLMNGHISALPPEATFFHCSLHETRKIKEILKRHQVTEVLHFAALIEVSLSTVDPFNFYDNNVAGTMSLLSAMDETGVRKLVFSSTCAIYGATNSSPISEEAPENPTNPYARSKLMVEHILRDIMRADLEWSIAVLRYFNVAGCSRNGLLGEDHRPETHLIPLVLQTALRQREFIEIYGDDYDTRDGTCIRDYVFVEDLVDAHLLALDNLTPGALQCFNLGSENGFTVREVIESAERVTGMKIPFKMGSRRSGDAPCLTASSSAIQTVYGWVPKLKDLDSIIETAWNWMQKHPHGYPD